jgi:hypothetical protein
MADTAFALAASRTRVVMEIERLRKAFPELNDDLDLLADSIEGQTDFDQLCDAILAQYVECLAMREGVKAHIEAMKAHIEAMKARDERFGKAADVFKNLLHDLVKASGQTTVRRPLATLSIAKGRSKLVLDDDFNAQGYMRTFAPEPMRADIAAALAAGDEIPGARLEPGEPIFSVRTK